MNAIIPLNIKALRVSKNDQTTIVGKFKGRTAVFEKLPYQNHGTGSSTGDAIVQPLESNSSPANPLGAGIHLHWALPDFFKRGVQPAQGGDLEFPRAPNRWLVTRYLSIFDPTSQSYEAAVPKSFLVESDYISQSPQPDAFGVIRPAISVPLPVNPSYGEQPYRYMGRVLNYDSWSPSQESPSDFLPSYQDENGNPLYLNSIGFLGPGFSAYYPDCSSVFGFWDHFKDNSEVYNAINQNLPIQFKVTYQVTGWIQESQEDPLNDLGTLITQEYNTYVSECKSQQVAIKKTPSDFFESICLEKYKWIFNKDQISYTLNPDQSILSLDVPEGTLCCGVLQETIWNMLENPSTSYFLKNDSNKTDPSLWTDTVKLAAGNTVIDALSALLKGDMGQEIPEEGQLSYEYLLDALQLGLLNNLDQEHDKLITLQEALHSQGFSQFSGGKLWTIDLKPTDPNQVQNPDEEVTLPLQVAEYLHALNHSQKTYDQARAALDASRKQVFMDWLHYIKMYTGEITDPNVDLNQLTSFLLTNTGGEINEVIQEGNQTGILYYQQDEVNGQVTAILEPSQSANDSLAYSVWNNYSRIEQEMAQYPDWQLQCVPAPAFWQPTDPVVIMEGDKMEPVIRNTRDGSILARVSGQLITEINLDYQQQTFAVFYTDLRNIPTVADYNPMQQDVQNLIYESYFTIPTLASFVQAALQQKGGSGNPASMGQEFTATLQAAQGGLSAMVNPTPLGFFEQVHQQNYIPLADPSISVTSPLAIDFTLSNSSHNGWLANPVAWNRQEAYPELSTNRFDPFLPTFMLWKVQLDPLKPNNGNNYNPQNLTEFFHLDTDAIDYQYQVIQNVSTQFTKGFFIPYENSVILSTKSTFSLSQQIDTYIKNYPDDSNDQYLEEIRDSYNNRKILSQAVGGFNLEQTLRAYIPQIEVEDLTMGSRDTITTALNNAAHQNTSDNWYNFSFNSQSPIATGPLAQKNFGPLRSGFLEVIQLGIVDVFGQQMEMETQNLNPGGSLQATPSIPLLPASDDTGNIGKIFLPPRVLAPTRLWFKWLSAEFDSSIPGFTGDFVEMNSHPATSPICGWILPNHLDENLFFYDSAGMPIGSFGVEHGELTYRTRPGNLANAGDNLEADIGPENNPSINVHTANLMWFIQNSNNALLLEDLMGTIENSGQYINPSSYPQDTSLAVLVGRPLAITRAVLGLETAGNVLPVSQADTDPNDPFPQDVAANRTKYRDRMAASNAQLTDVNFPVRLGDLANINDGLVCFLPESTEEQPYTDIYSPAAVGSGANHVLQPLSTTTQLQLNAPAISYTFLIDPRAPIHATTGILPVQELQIPEDQYQEAMNSLAMLFFTHPVFQAESGLVLPLPMETGYNWSWINPGSDQLIPLKDNAGNEFASFNYSPQTALEGWLQLLPAPKSDLE